MAPENNPQMLGYLHACKSAEDAKRRQARAGERRRVFLESLGKREPDFLDDMALFLEKNNLGKEWANTIIDLIVSGWVSVPNQNLHFYKREQGPRAIVLELNADTSLRDIKEVFPHIERAQKELWPNHKKRNVTSQMYDNLRIAIEDRVERTKTPVLKDSHGKTYKRKDLDTVGMIWVDAGEETSTEITDEKLRARLRKIRQRFTRKK